MVKIELHHFLAVINCINDPSLAQPDGTVLLTDIYNNAKFYTDDPPDCFYLVASTAARRGYIQFIGEYETRRAYLLELGRVLISPTATLLPPPEEHEIMPLEQILEKVKQLSSGKP